MKTRSFLIHLIILGLAAALLGTAHTTRQDASAGIRASDSNAQTLAYLSSPLFSDQIIDNLILFRFSLRVNVRGNGTVSKDPDKSSYFFNEPVTVTAIPDAGWKFIRWSGDLSGTAETVTIRMTEDKNITAHFEPEEYALNVLISGSGTVTKDPDRTGYLYGETVTLTASRQPGWTFNGWSLDLTGSSNPATITMTGEKIVQANFTQHAPTGIHLSRRNVEENQPAGTTVGALSTMDEDWGEAHTYALVLGRGDADNGFFTIEGDLLKTNAIFDYEQKNSYTIRVRTIDITQLPFERTVTIQIRDVNEAPLALAEPFSIASGETLTVTAPGVLGSDSDPEDNSLAAVLDRGPEHAAHFQLNADGSFVYQPEEAFVGVDAFDYHASDGSLSSNVATIEIYVYDGFSPQVEWMSPVGNGEVYNIDSEPVLLEVQAQDDIAIDMVRFYRWDAEAAEFIDIGVVETAPFQWELDPNSLNLGWNQVFAKAYDVTGNESGRVWIWLKHNPTYRLFLPNIYH